MAKRNRQKYVQRGADLIFECDPVKYRKDLRDLNRGKNGAPYKHPDMVIMAGAVLRAKFNVSYNNLQGMLYVMLKDTPYNAPDASTLQRRINRIKARDENGVLILTDLRPGGAIPQITREDVTQFTIDMSIVQ